MPRSFRFREGYIKRIKMTETKASCAICGKRIDIYHQTSKCDADYQAKCDAEAKAKKEGRG